MRPGLPSGTFLPMAIPFKTAEAVQVRTCTLINFQHGDSVSVYSGDPKIQLLVNTVHSFLISAFLTLPIPLHSDSSTLCMALLLPTTMPLNTVLQMFWYILEICKEIFLQMASDGSGAPGTIRFNRSHHRPPTRSVSERPTPMELSLSHTSLSLRDGTMMPIRVTFCHLGRN